MSNTKTKQPPIQLAFQWFEHRWVGGLVVWAVTWAALLVLDPKLELATEAVILLLACALSALTLGLWWTLLASALAVFLFDVSFVPPRGTWVVNVHHDALLLLAMLVVAWIISALVAKLQEALLMTQAHAERAESLRVFADQLRESASVEAAGHGLLRAIESLAGVRRVALLLDTIASQPNSPLASGNRLILGPCDRRHQEGLQSALDEGQSFGPGTGRYEEQPYYYLPVLGAHRAWGSVLVEPFEEAVLHSLVLEHVELLCNQLGSYLDRWSSEQQAQHASEQVQAQALRNTLLEAIAHDYRTPLATIANAAEALLQLSSNPVAERTRGLAQTIADETLQLTRIADNTLQLARLETLMADIPLDWESPEEMVGAVVRRMRQRHPDAHLRLDVHPCLPLLRCDATLIVQLLDNLIDNALKYGDVHAPVEIAVYQAKERLIFDVRDHGPGIDPAYAPLLFQPFQRHVGPAQQAMPRGTGMGLALCKAIAQVHHGALDYLHAQGGGALFRLSLPVAVQPTGWCEASPASV
ncbi:sensor histidine kinase [Lampropedia puyangensis]|nr:ATP-binding protein [Lampropedia puyangensis]